jgi:hypothetical protein
MLAVALLTGSVCAQPAASPGPQAKEHELKAAFIYNFLKFAEWPSNRFENATAPFVVGVHGEDLVFEMLVVAVRNRSVGGRPISVRHVTNIDDASACHLIFFAKQEDSSAPALLSALRDASVLTVGESPVFGRNGGMINFVYEGDKLRFEINISSVERSNLHLSAQLQKLARKVHRGS